MLKENKEKILEDRMTIEEVEIRRTGSDLTRWRERKDRIGIDARE